MSAFMKAPYFVSVIVLLPLALAAVAWLVLVSRNEGEVHAVVDFDSCVAAGYPVLESYPRQCQTPQGGHFVENTAAEWDVSYTNASEDLIRGVSIAAGDAVLSPLLVTGEARGYWFFEASFPIVLTDWDGRIIAEGHATAEGDWMTENFVPFTATIEFQMPAGPGGPLNRGTLILMRDNPSGLPEHGAALEIPVVFQ